MHVMARLRSLLWRRRVEREVDEELRFHLEMETEALVARGVPAGEAARQARLALGGADQTAEAVRDVRAPWLESIARDIAYAPRSFNRDRSVSLATILSIALSVGLAASLYSIGEAVLLRPLPYDHPERLLSIWRTFEGLDFCPLPVSDVRALEAHASSLAGVAGLVRSGALVMTGHVTEWADAFEVTPNLFDVLGVRPLLGRTFRPDEDQAGKHAVAILTERLWREQFLGDPSIVGRRVQVKREGTRGAPPVPYEIVGVVPTDMEFFYPTRLHADLYIPRLAGSGQPGDAGTFSPTYFAIARLGPGVAPARATADVDAVLRHADRAAGPQRPAGLGVRVASLHEELVGRTRPTFLLLAVGVALLLLIGSVNIAHLLLAAGLRRAPELTTRVRLGCSRARLVRQLLTENLLLAGIGGLLGGLVAAWLAPLLVGVAPRSLPRIATARVDLPVLAFALATTALVSVLSTILPALVASRPDGGLDARGVTASRRRARLDAGLIVVQTAFTLALVAGASLLGRSAWRLAHLDPGFRAQGVLVANVVLPERLDTPGSRYALKTRILDAVRSLPGIRDAAMASDLPFSWGIMAGATSHGDRRHRVVLNEVSPGYPPLLGLPLVRGRMFAATDLADRHVVLVNDEFARRLGGASALGERIRIEDESRVVVGVVGDVSEIGMLSSGLIRRPGLDRLRLPAVYVPLGSVDNELSRIVVRTDMPVPVAFTRISAELHRLTPDLALRHTSSLEDLQAASGAQTRFAAIVLVLFAAVGVALSTVGLYASLSHVVARRTREIGIRAAIGASRRQIRLAVVGRLYLLVAFGAVVGGAGWLAAGRVVKPLLFESAPSDPGAFAAAVLVLAAVVVLAGWLPLRRAIRVEPTVALRAE